MSVINIHCDEQSWGEVFPGIFLVRLRNPLEDYPYPSPNGIPVTNYCFALTIMNDPFLIFPEKPVVDKYWGIEDEDVEAMVKETFSEYISRISYIRKLEYCLKGELSDMGKLWEAIKAAGWKQDTHGSPIFFIWHKVGEYITTHRGKQWWKRLGS